MFPFLSSSFSTPYDLDNLPSTFIFSVFPDLAQIGELMEVLVFLNAL